MACIRCVCRLEPGPPRSSVELPEGAPTSSESQSSSPSSTVAEANISSSSFADQNRFADGREFENLVFHENVRLNTSLI